MVLASDARRSTMAAALERGRNQRRAQVLSLQAREHPSEALNVCRRCTEREFYVVSLDVEKGAANDALLDLRLAAEERTAAAEHEYDEYALICARAQKALAVGDEIPATMLLKRATRLKPRRSVAHFALGHAYALAEDFVRASQSFSAAAACHEPGTKGWAVSTRLAWDARVRAGPCASIFCVCARCEALPPKPAWMASAPALVTAAESVAAVEPSVAEAWEMHAVAHVELHASAFGCASDKRVPARSLARAAELRVAGAEREARGQGAQKAPHYNEALAGPLSRDTSPPQRDVLSGVYISEV
jgi:hypothetical protein